MDLAQLMATRPVGRMNAEGGPLAEADARARRAVLALVQAYREDRGPTAPLLVGQGATRAYLRDGTHRALACLLLGRTPAVRLEPLGPASERRMARRCTHTVGDHLAHLFPHGLDGPEDA